MTKVSLALELKHKQIQIFLKEIEKRERNDVFNSRRQCKENNRMLSLREKRDNEASQFIRNSKKYLTPSSE